jgi:hypothetical protein
MSSRPELKIDWATYEAAKYACEHWHYSRCIPKSKLAKIGVWEDGVFIGSIIFGVGATADLVKQYGLKMQEGCELVRVALTTHKAPVSRMIAISLKLLKRTFPGLRLIVSFADPEHDHHGGIYQAGNWIFSGYSQASDEYIYKGKRWQGRSFRNKYKGMENHPDVVKVKGSSKIRYLMPLDDEMRKRIEPLRKPYPKRDKQAIGNDQLHSDGCVTSIDSDAPGDQLGERGASPTVTLQNNNEVHNAENP